MRRLIVLILILSATQPYAQSLTYQLQVALGDFVLPGNIQETSDGGLIVCGTVSTGPDANAFLVKIDPTGNIEWKKTYGSLAVETGKYVIQSSDSGYLMVGTIRVTPQNEDMYVVRTNFAGDTLWTRSYGNTSNDYGNSVIELPSGNFLITGTSVISTARAAILRIDPQGVLLGSNFTTSVYASPNMKARMTGPNQLSVTGTFATEVHTDTMGNYLSQINIQLGGSGNSSDAILSSQGWNISTGTMDIGSPGGTRIALARSDDATSPSSVWVKSYYVLQADLVAGSLLQTNDGTLVVAGHINPFNTSATGGFLLLAVDSTGSIKWMMKYYPVYNEEYTVGTGITTTDGGFAICGSVAYGSVSDLVVIKTDSAGYSGCNEVAVTTPFSSAAYLTPPPLSAFAGSVSNAGTWINSATASPGNANVLCTSVNSTGTQTNEPVIIHPNPFINELFVDGMSENSSGLFCEISDLAGRIVFSATIHAGNRIFTIPPIGSGVYLVKIYSGTTLVTKQKMMCMN